MPDLSEEKLLKIATDIANQIPIEVGFVTIFFTKDDPPSQVQTCTNSDMGTVTRLLKVIGDKIK